MIASLIGAGLGAVGSIFGGISASNAMKKQKKALEKQQQDNQAWYNKRYNEDATQRADAQRILTRTEDAIRNRNRAAAGTAAVMGSTEEGVAATKAANNEMVADAVSRIAVAGDARKDAIESQYRATDAQLRQQLNAVEANKANNVATAVKSLGGVASAIGSMDFSKGKSSNEDVADVKADPGNSNDNIDKNEDDGIYYGYKLPHDH